MRRKRRARMARWQCDVCGKLGSWGPGWSHVFLGGPCAVFCSDACCDQWHTAPTTYPMQNFTQDGDLIEHDDQD